MRKNIYLLLFAIISLADKGNAQTVMPCNTPVMQHKYLDMYPEIAKYEVQLENDTKNYIANQAKLRALGRKTVDDSGWFDIPLVVHVIHDYGKELDSVDDNKIYNLVAEMNRFYSLQNNVSTVIAPFKPYIGKAKIRFHLATKDPFGKQTKGITHRYSYLTNGGDDQAKFDQWNPSNYINIWFEGYVGSKPKTGTIVAYATPPSTAAVAPYRDGIISNYDFIDDAVTNGAQASGGSIDHEMGHILNLEHTFGPSNNPHTNVPGNCSEDDNVDDTPPTEGNLGGCSLWDTVCSGNYFKLYPKVIGGGDSLVNYPDTSNEQNIMNYADCKVMFTLGQVDRMHAALKSSVGGRDSLSTTYNLALTGALQPTLDLPAVVDFNVRDTSTANARFTCPGTRLTFKSACWGDTVQTVSWTFSNDAAIASVTNTVAATSTKNVLSIVRNSFSTPGWVSVTLAATGNNTATTTETFPRAAFVADAVGKDADGYFMEFDNADTAKWPIFNYYNNEFKWKYVNTGVYDNNAIEYTGYDGRGFTTTGSPFGDYDDIFSMPMDLSKFKTTACNLNYFYSSASRTSNTYDINDALTIYYSVDHAKTWKKMDSITKERLVNKGSVSTDYAPSVRSDWSPMSITVPDAARTEYTVFRFRYRPGVSLAKETGIMNLSDGSYPTGNNFFMDRIYFSQMPAGVDNTHMSSIDVKVMPNPTSGDAYVLVKDASNGSATVVVSDITGKQIYTVSQQISGNEANILIPREAISVKGIYMVQTTTGNQSKTQKLVVY